VRRKYFFTDLSPIAVGLLYGDMVSVYKLLPDMKYDASVYLRLQEEGKLRTWCCFGALRIYSVGSAKTESREVAKHGHGSRRDLEPRIIVLANTSSNLP
jgi:hypothetical protein